jgi:hypothetical protein
MRHVNVAKAQIKVARALQDACIGTELAVRASDGITGGSVIGETIEAYVVAEPPGYQVEIWTHTGNDAFRVILFPTLDAAIQCAIDAAADHRDAYRH